MWERCSCIYLQVIERFYQPKKTITVMLESGGKRQKWVGRVTHAPSLPQYSFHRILPLSFDVSALVYTRFFDFTNAILSLQQSMFRRSPKCDTRYKGQFVVCIVQMWHASRNRTHHESCTESDTWTSSMILFWQFSLLFQREVRRNYKTLSKKDDFNGFKFEERLVRQML